MSYDINRTMFLVASKLEAKPILILSYPGAGGKIRPLLFFLQHPKTAQGIKLKLSDFKDTPLRHILEVKPVL